MASIARAAVRVDRSRSTVGPGTRAGWRILIPGYPQWRWQQQQRGLVLFGSYASALAVALFAWGTLGGQVLLAFAVGTHVTSVADVVRQAAFPGFSRWVSWFSATFGIGLGCYGPLLAMAGVMAWPTSEAEQGYVINLCSYRSQAPRPDHWVWLSLDQADQDRPDPGPRVARVLATSAQRVESSEGRLRRGGDGRAWIPLPPSMDDRCRFQRFQVPDGYLLVDVVMSDRDGGPIGPRLVPESRVLGRAWAQLYPVWSRRLLR